VGIKKSLWDLNVKVSARTKTRARKKRKVSEKAREVGWRVLAPCFGVWSNHFTSPH
jgi:hypothetical protein